MNNPIDPSNPYPDITQHPLYQGVFTPDMISPEPTPTPPSITFSFPDLTSTAQFFYIRQWLMDQLVKNHPWPGNYMDPPIEILIQSPTLLKQTKEQKQAIYAAIKEVEALRQKASATMAETEELEDLQAFVTSFNNLTRFG